MFTWPIIIQYAGSDELQYIHNAEEWAAEHVYLAIDSKDQIIDSTGQCYHYQPPHLATQETLSLDDILPIIRAHFVCCGTCCSAKIGANSIPEALSLLHTAS